MRNVSICNVFLVCRDSPQVQGAQLYHDPHRTIPGCAGLSGNLAPGWQRPTEQSVTDDLELLIAALAHEKAHHHQCSLAAARCQVRGLSDRAREEYRGIGAP